MGLVSKDMLWIVMNVIIWELELKEFEDNKGVIRIRKSKKDRQHNDLQNITHKLYMGRSANYGRNSNIFHITNGLNFMHRK
jgi:hypothetical protein